MSGVQGVRRGPAERVRPGHRGEGGARPSVAVVVTAALAALLVAAGLLLGGGAVRLGPGAESSAPSGAATAPGSGDGTGAGPSAPGTVEPLTPSVDPAALRLQALDELLAARADAVLRRDRAAWLATVDPAAGEFAARQAQVLDHLAEVPLADWRYEYAGEGPSLSAERRAVLGPEAWVARVVLVYRLDTGAGPAGAGPAGAESAGSAGSAGPAGTAGTVTGEVRREQHLTLVRRGDDWFVADDQDGDTAPDLWDLGPVHVVRGQRSLVLGTAPVADLTRYAAETDDAAVRVDAVWGGDWPRTVVVLVPRSQEEMARLLLRDDDAGLEQIAAVTTGEVGLDDPGESADRIVVNPAGFDQLGPLGRRVVLTHEITHVATRATTTQAVPIWLSEGFADHVAYRDTGVAKQVIAQDVLDRVRAGQLPAALPTRLDFDPSHGDIAPAYSGSWLAADLVAVRWGEEALVGLYRTVAAGTPVDEALTALLGLDEAAFTREWQAYLTQLAS